MDGTLIKSFNVTYNELVERVTKLEKECDVLKDIYSDERGRVFDAPPKKILAEKIKACTANAKDINQEMNKFAFKLHKNV